MTNTNTELLAQAIGIIAAEPTLRPVADILRTLPISFGPRPDGTIATFSLTPHPHIIVTDGEPLEVNTLAATLLHEGTHALDHATGKLSDGPHGASGVSAYISDEIRAARAESEFWANRYPNGSGIDSLLAQEEDMRAREMHAGRLEEDVARTYMAAIFGGWAMRFFIHVAPQNLRQSEQTDTDTLPIWVIRPVCAPEQTAQCAQVVSHGPMVTQNTRHNPLPGTDGHGWAYLETADDAGLSVRTVVGGPWMQADELFVGRCSVVPPSITAEAPVSRPSWGYGGDDDDQSEREMFSTVESVASPVSHPW